MPLVSGSGIVKYFGGFEVLRRVGFNLEAGDRVGLVGANGCGKTTLLRLIVGSDEPNEGHLERQRQLRLGYLPQTAPELLGSTLWGVLLEPFRPLLELEATLADLSHQMAAPDCPPRLVERYSALQTEFEHRGGYRINNRIETVLSGLGFPREQYHAPLSQLSGGWRTRAQLARLLLEEPELLLLDEPTNNLDLDAVRWLEQFLQDYHGALLIVSHDRFFLDRLCTRIWDLCAGTLEVYRGNYTDSRRQRAERRARRWKEYEQQQDFIHKEEDFIRRNIEGQRSREAQGRRTKLARFVAEEAVTPPPEEHAVHWRLAARQRTGDLVLTTSELVVGYAAERPLVRVADLQVLRGERLAIVGPNGGGKTTLLRTLLGELPPLSGSFRLGANVFPGYLSQTHDVLDPEHTLLDAIREVQTTKSDAEARNFLGSLLFSGDDAFKRVADLSGGQRARLALGRLALTQPTLLLLDEPTNHLDLPTMEVLQEALLAYDGTIIVVSHDRYLVQALAHKLLIVENGSGRLFDGTWEDWQAQRNAPAMPEADAGGAGPEVPDARTRFQQERRRQNELQRKQRRCAEVEAQVHALDDERRSLEAGLVEASTTQDLERLRQLTARYREMEPELEQRWEEWATLTAEIEELTKADG